MLAGMEARSSGSFSKLKGAGVSARLGTNLL